MIIGTNVTYRRPTNADDDIVFDSYIDWEDLQGIMTRSRASRILEFMIGENEYAHWPIDSRSSFKDNWIIQWIGTDIGVVRITVHNMNVSFDSLTLIPAYRGLTYFNELYRSLAFAAFECYKSTTLTYEAFDDVPAMQAIRTRHQSDGGARTTKQRISEATARAITERTLDDTVYWTWKDTFMDGYTFTVDVALLDSLQASYRRWDGSLGSHSYAATERAAPMYTFLTLTWTVDPEWGKLYVPASLTLMYDVEA